MKAYILYKIKTNRSASVWLYLLFKNELVYVFLLFFTLLIFMSLGLNFRVTYYYNMRYRLCAEDPVFKTFWLPTHVSMLNSFLWVSRLTLKHELIKDVNYISYI